jgi:hypothetical protein
MTVRTLVARNGKEAVVALKVGCGEAYNWQETGVRQSNLCSVAVNVF